MLQSKERTNTKRVLCKMIHIMNKYHVKEKLFFTALYILFVAVLYSLDAECFFLSITGKQCPGCGMTRAWLLLIRGEFGKAFSMHPLYFTVPILYLYILLDGHLFKNVYVNYIVLGLIFGGFFILFMVRLFT